MIGTNDAAGRVMGSDVQGEGVRGGLRVPRRAVQVAKLAKPKLAKPKRSKPGRGDGLVAWAYSGVAGALALSGWLNGLAFGETAPSPLAGWVLGLAIPAGLLVFARVAALLWGRGRRGLAWAGGGACMCILALSVQHVAASISRLTGEPVALSALMAVAVDVGLVVCELATVRR